jgi:hypothetical protein
MREAGQKSRDIVHAAHEDKQRLEMVLRDLHSAEQEARQRLRAMSGAILSHLDDTEALVAESSGNFRAIVQAHPEATELRSTSMETMSDVAERAAIVAEAAVAAEEAAEAERVEREQVDQKVEAAERVSLDATLAASVVERIVETDEHMPAAELRRTDVVDSLETTMATGATADAFFDAPPSFDHTEVAPRSERSERSGEPVASFADYE